MVCAPIQYYYRIAMEFAQVIYNEILWAQLSYGHDKEFYEVTNGEVYALTNSMIPAFVTFLSMVAAEAKYYDDKRIISRNTINDLEDQGVF